MAALPEPWKSLRAELEKMREQIRALYNRSPFFGTGMHANGNGGIDSDNFAAGVSGYSFKSDGNAEFNDLTLRGGIIGNDALTDPIEPQVARLYAENFSLTTSYGQKASTSLTVPSGCTRLLAVVRASMYVVNANTTGGSDGAGGDATYVRATLAGGNTGGSPIGLSGSNGFTTTTSDDSFDLTGLTPGGTVSFTVEGKSGYQSIPAYVDNWVKAVATLIWLR